MEEKRLRIVEACKQSFSLFGYKGTTVEQIAKIAGVGKGTLYLYFQTKEDILNEIVQQLVSEMTTLADKSLQTEGTRTERLHRSIFSCLQFRKDHEMLMKLTQEVAQFGTEPAKNALALIEEQLVAALVSLMRKGLDSNCIRAENLEVTAYTLFKMYIALAIEWEKKHDKLTDEQIFQLLQQFIMHGLIPDKTD